MLLADIMMGRVLFLVLVVFSVRRIMKYVYWSSNPESRLNFKNDSAIKYYKLMCPVFKIELFCIILTSVILFIYFINQPGVLMFSAVVIGAYTIMFRKIFQRLFMKFL